MRTAVIVLILVCSVVGADSLHRTGLTAGVEAGLGSDDFSWVEGTPANYSYPGGTVFLAAVSAGVWVSPSFRLLAQFPAMWLVPGYHVSRPETITALFPGAQLSYHVPDSGYYYLFSSGWIVTFNTGGDAGAPSVQGPVFGGGAGYWLSPHLSIKAEGTFSSVHTELNGAKTTVKHLVIWTSLCAFL